MTETLAVNLTKAAEDTDLLTLGAPADLRAPCTRDVFRRPPDWRCQEACQYLSEERNRETPTIPTDIIVQYAIRALRAYAPHMSGGSKKFLEKHVKKYVMNLWPVMDEVLYYGVYARRSSVSAELDTCIIKGFDYKTARIAGCPLCRASYDLYQALFFDLSGVRAVHAWINDFLFEPEKYTENTTLLRSRLLAYYGASTTGIGASVTGTLTEQDEAVMRRIVKNERQKKLFDYIVKTTNLDAVTYAEIMEAAVKSMSEHDFQEHMKDREDAGSESLEDLAVDMEKGIRAFSQHELEACDKTGLDFINQYTQALAGNHNESQRVPHG